VLAENTPVMQRNLDDIRTVLLHLALLTDWSLEQKLFFMTFFAKRTTRYMNSKTEEVALAPLSDDVDFILKTSVLEELATQYQDVPSNDSMGASLIGTLLDPNLTNSPSKRFEVLLSSARKVLVDDNSQPLTGDALFAAYHERVELVRKRCGESLDERYTRLLAHYLVSDLLCDSNDLLHYMEIHLFTRAVQQLLLVTHPLMNQLLDSNASDIAFEAALDECMTDVVYSTARVIQHTRLLQNLQSIMESTEGERFAVALSLLRF
jgi:hypothetical protein